MQATHVVASRYDALPAVTRTRTGGAAAASDRLIVTVGLPGRVRRRVGPARRDSESGVQRPPRPLQRRSHRRRRAALLRSTVAVTGHGHGRTHFERSPSHGSLRLAGPPPSQTAAPEADSDPAAGRDDLPAVCDRVCKYDSGDQTAVHTLVPSPNRRGARAIICCIEEKIDLPGSVKSCPDKGKVLVQAMGACKPIELRNRVRISLDSSLDSWSEAATNL